MCNTQRTRDVPFLVKNVSPVHRAPTKPESRNRKRLTQTENIMMRREMTKKNKKQI